jgi:hypothetical protein
MISRTAYRFGRLLKFFSDLLLHRNQVLVAVFSWRGAQAYFDFFLSAIILS